MKISYIQEKHKTLKRKQSLTTTRSNQPFVKATISNLQPKSSLSSQFIDRTQRTSPNESEAEVIESIVQREYDKLHTLLLE